MFSLANRRRGGAALLCALGFLAVVLGAPSKELRAWDGSVTYVHFSDTVGLPAGVVLPAGEYTFEAVRSDVVRVSSRDGRRVFYSGFTHRVPRPRDLNPDVMISLGERPANGVSPVRAWFPLPTGSGHAFIYK